jgi:hypothetical protein
MPIKAQKLLNPVGSITLNVIILNDQTGLPEEQSLTFQHKLVTAGAWVESQQHKKPATEKNRDQQPSTAGDAPAAEEADTRYLLDIDPDALTDEQLREVVSQVPIVSEVMDFLVSWDVVGDDDLPLPVTERNLLKLDLKLLREMATAHYQASFPNWTTSQI